MMKNKIDGVQALCDKFAIHLNRYDNGKIDRDAKLILGIYAKTHREMERERERNVGNMRNVWRIRYKYHFHKLNDFIHWKALETQAFVAGLCVHFKQMAIR